MVDFRPVERGNCGFYRLLGSCNNLVCLLLIPTLSEGADNERTWPGKLRDFFKLVGIHNIVILWII